MRGKILFVFIALYLLVGTTFYSSVVSAQSIGGRRGNDPYQDSAYGYSGSGGFNGRSSGASYGSYQSRPTFQTYYGRNLETYWPILGDRETCEARQDLLLNVAPFGCQPSVVRSDLLAEQNVPVFCQLDAFKVNPLIDVNQIRSIRFSGDYPDSVVGSGFHPARAALRTHDTLLGSPLVNNVGYVVLVLKKQEDESLLPDFVNVTLDAEIEYAAGNAYGIGRSEFLLESTSDSRWERERLKNSFWNGRYFVRLDNVDTRFATVSIYNGDEKVMTSRVERGKVSEEVFLPGLYCRAGLQIAYDGFESADRTATIEVSSGNGVDVFEVTEGSRFLDDRCTIRRIDVDNNASTGSVEGNCKGWNFVLKLGARGGALFSNFVVDGVTKIPEKDQNSEAYVIDLSDHKDSKKKGIYELDLDGNLVAIEEGRAILVYDDGELNDDETPNKDGEWLLGLWRDLEEYKEKIRQNANFVIGELGNRELGESKKYFDAAIRDYEQVVDGFPFEKEADFEGARRYGEMALAEAIDLAERFGQNGEKARLINKYLETYPGSGNFSDYASELDDLHRVDSSLSGEVIEFDDQTRVIRLLDVDEPTDGANAKLRIGGDTVPIDFRERLNLTDSGRKVGEIVLDDVDPDRVSVGAYCLKTRNGEEVLGRKERYGLILDGSSQLICGLDVRLDGVNSREAARIRLIPKADSGRTQTSFNVGVGIEKRAINLSPFRAREKIDSLNETIQDWEKISDNLGNVVTGMKSACFATAAVLTFKNFLSGLSGETLARQEVMQGDEGWRNWCRKEVALGNYGGSIDKCYFDNSAQIDSDVSRTTTALEKVNARIQEIQKKHEDDRDVFGKGLNVEKMRAELAEEIRTEYGDVPIDVSKLKRKWVIDGEVQTEVEVSDLLSEKNVKDEAISTDAMRSIMLYSELEKSGGLSSSQGKNIDSKFADIAERVNDNAITFAAFEKKDDLKNAGFGSPFYAAAEGQRDRLADVRSVSSSVRSSTGFGGEIGHTSTVIVSAVKRTGDGGVSVSDFGAGTYILGLQEADAGQGEYIVKDVWYKEEGRKVDAGKFVSEYGVGRIKSIDRDIDQNEIFVGDRVVTYFDNEPYRGMPAIVPFDTKQGWYAATRQTLPAFGGIGAFDASGRVTSFWLCNVGGDGQIDFENGFDDDLCQQINLNTGQPLGSFPGKSESEARSLVSRAIQAINDAARQYGNEVINIGRERFKSGVSVGQPGTQCQDFMSPDDCWVMFNVCDPVICPSSRCDFGGQYPVANVAQTGIIGSTLLCLPNVKEGIVVPVCLTGIHAGIDGLVSVMKNYRDCLQENIDTGRTVGICDQIYSIYLCEFLWNQIAPVVNVLLPKLIEVAVGQGTRGGAEYLSVMSAWQNVENSIDYFTQSYAVNSFEAFKVRSVESAGGQVCKSFVSAKAPSVFESLVEPDSPPQFHAWFDQKKFTTATVPATSQYKVFYHIFAGKDSGSYFNVFLKNPPESSYYLTAQQLPVASGFIPSGEYASETKDFTAPEGYKELCVRVNEQEECGFGQVSTSFAVDYLKDQFVKDELLNRNIQSEKECISGGNNVGALLNPNLQAGVGEVVSPEIYNRGVVRICSTRNPGLSTDPTRFVNVGNCGDINVGCWLDQRSVENSLEFSNVADVNETLQVLQNRTIQYMQDQGELFDTGMAVGEINSLESALSGLGGDAIEQDARTILDRADFVFERLVFNHHKAQLLLVRARVNRAVALELFKKVRAKELSDLVLTEREPANTATTVSDVVDTPPVVPPAVETDDALPAESDDATPTVPETEDNIPLNVECSLNFPTWLKNGVDELENNAEVNTDDVVSASVRGNAACDGMDIEFNVYENEPALLGDDFLVSLNAVMVRGLARALWDVTWLNDGAFQRNPEFYFNYGISGGEISEVVSSNVRVLKPVGPEDPSFPGIILDDGEVFLGGDNTGFSLEEGKMLFNGLEIGEIVGGIIRIGPEFIGDNENGVIMVHLNGRPLQDLVNGIEYDPYLEIPNTYEITNFNFYKGSSLITGGNVEQGDELRIDVTHDCDYVRIAVSHEVLGSVISEDGWEEVAFSESLGTSDSGTYTALVECKKDGGQTVNQDIETLIRVDVVAEGMSNP